MQETGSECREDGRCGLVASGMADKEENPNIEEENEEIGGSAEGGQGKRETFF